MSSIYNTLYKAIQCSEDFCSLCFKDVDKNEKLSFYDEIALNNNITNLVSIHNILLDVLGSNILNNTTSSAVCDSCMKSAVESFKFIDKCKQNSEKLLNALEFVDISFKNVDHLDGVNTLYTELDLQSNISKQYYDVRRPVKNSYAALKRFNSIKKISNTLFKIKDEKVDFKNDSCTESDVYYSTKTKKSKKKDRKITFDIAIKDVMVENAENYTCKVCLSSFETAHRLKFHYLRTHTPKTIKCEKCSSRFSCEAFLEWHMTERHADIVCEECGDVLPNKRALYNHELSHQGKLSCPTCGKHYKNSQTLNYHMKLDVCQAGPKRRDVERKKKQVACPFTCNLCGNIFERQSSLRAHLKYIHSDCDKPFTCEWCDKKFHMKSTLAQHILKHTKEKKFRCTICGGTFVSKLSLTYHMRIHTGEKPFQCEYCDLRFLSSSRRADHTRHMHEKKSQVCSMCKKEFKSTTKMKKHQERHLNPKSKLYILNT